MTDRPPDQWGYWQAEDGLWYPPEMHPQHHRVEHAPPPPPQHGFHLPPLHAERVQPVHQRPGAGSYTVKPVYHPSKNWVRTVLIVAAALVAAGAIVVGVIASGAFDDDVSSKNTSSRGPSTATCAAEKEQLGAAVLGFRAKYGVNASSEAALVPEFLTNPVAHWDYAVDPAGNPVLTGVDGCA
jgi:hypothetical protein